ncbi:2-hydroxyacid dehydrogenase, partial [Pseudomonas sp. K5002]|nr:2-hydroxyacid dehydrogenase [Pseudomonas sp. K5002]
MRIILFSSQTYDRDSFLAQPLPEGMQLQFQPARLNLDTVALAEHHEVVCAFNNDDLSAPVLEQLASGGTRLIALRSAGYNHVDL